MNELSFTRSATADVTMARVSPAKTSWKTMKSRSGMPSPSMPTPCRKTYSRFPISPPISDPKARL